MKKSKRFKQSYLDTYMHSWRLTNMWQVFHHAKKELVLRWASS